MLITLDVSDPRPLHEQVAGAIRRAIADGQSIPGDRLPPAKDLAAQLDVNSNTVLRALRELRDEGVLEFRRGRGITVADSAVDRSSLLEDILTLLDRANRHGYSRAEVITMIERLP